MEIKTNVGNLKNYQIYLKVESAVNEYLQKKGYLKVDLPVLSPSLIPESYLEVFETEFRFLDKKEKLYLTPSPELFLKRLIVHGIGDCYFLGKSFRNSDPSASLHSPEFTMLEFYKVGANYMNIADEVLEMLKFISQKLKIQNHKVSFEKWEKISVAEAFKKFAGIKEQELFNHKLFVKKAEEKGYRTTGFSYEDLWSQIYVQEIEKHLGENGCPTLIYDYPKEFAALAKLNSDKKTAQRFEFYINGIELGDCYTELTNWQEQEERFNEAQKERRKNKKIIHKIDSGFIDALKYGLPDCAGIAIGFERLALIFSKAKSIKELKLINIV